MDSTTVTSIHSQVSLGFGALASAFIVESLGHMIPWLIFAMAIIILDLITGIVKSVSMGMAIRPSKAVRDTMAKTVTYFAAVVVACFYTVASGGEGGVEKGTCIIIYIIEGISVFGNVLKARGYTVDSIALAGIIIQKFGFSKSDAAEAISRDPKEAGTGQNKQT